MNTLSLLKKRMALTTLVMVAVVFGMMAFLAAPASAQNQKLVCEQLGQRYDSANDTCLPPEGEQPAEDTVTDLISTVLNLLSMVVGVISVIMVVVGGIKYVLSGGDSNQTASAKNTIIFALVGLVIAAMSQVIVIFVLDKL